MKFTCPVRDLKTNLAIANLAVSTRVTHPILAYIKVEVKATTVGFSGFDFNISVQTNFIADVEEEGSLLLPAKLFSEIINKLPSGQIEIANNPGEEVVIIKSGTSYFEIASKSIEEFPELPEIEPGDTNEFSAAAFQEGLKGSLIACSKDETKQILMGVNIKGTPAELTFAATDGHRIGIAELSFTNSELVENLDNQASFDVTIPATALQAVSKILDPDADLEIQHSSTQVMFKSGDWTLTTRTLEGLYPKYRSLIAKNFDRQAIVDRHQLIESLERIGVFAGRAEIVQFTVNKETASIDLTVEDLLGNNGNESLPVEIEGSSLTFGFNIKYLLEGIKSLTTDTITMQSNGAKNPVVFTPIGDAKGLHLVMPVDLGLK